MWKQRWIALLTTRPCINERALRPTDFICGFTKVFLERLIIVSNLYRSNAGTKPHLPVVVERRVNWTVSAMVLVLSRDRHELLVRMFLLGRIICLAFFEVRSKPYDTISDTLHSYDQDALTFPSPPLVSQRLPRIRDQQFATTPLRSSTDSPSPVIFLTTPDIHQIVNRTTTPQHLASRLRHPFPSSLLLRHTLIAPIILFSANECRV